MDRRIALFSFFIFVLFACDDSSSYDTCSSNGCEKKERIASWHSVQSVAGTVTVDDTTFRDSEVRATRSGFVIERYESAPSPRDGGVDAEADAEVEAGTDAGADAGDAAPEERLHSYDGYYYGSTFRVRVSFVPPAAPGVYGLEDVGAVAAIEGSDTAAVDLTGTLEVLDVRSEDVSAPGAPVEPPYEMPFGWVMKTTNTGVAIDLRVESQATWSDGYVSAHCR